jgi:hypothetical protein
LFLWKNKVSRRVIKNIKGERIMKILKDFLAWILLLSEETRPIDVNGSSEYLANKLNIQRTSEIFSTEEQKALHARDNRGTGTYDQEDFKGISQEEWVTYWTEESTLKA